MRVAGSLLTIAATLAMTHSVMAAAPKPAGKYMFMSFSNCEANVRTARDPQGDIISVVPQNSGVLSASVGYMEFTPASPGASNGQATMTATMVEGGSLRIDGSGFAMRQRPDNHSGAYSFTDTTFTFEGMTFVMTHANNGRQVYLLRRENARCLNAISATRVLPER
jgi:hypothetical protein